MSRAYLYNIAVVCVVDIYFSLLSCRRQLATDRGDLQSILGQLSGSGCRKRLRATAARSPGGTPLTGWGSKKVLTPEGVRVFNQLLVDKFRNVKTPPSPYPGRQASPGTFDSPL